MVQRAITILVVLAALAIVFLLPRALGGADEAAGVPAIQLRESPQAEPTPDRASQRREEARERRRARERRERERRQQARRRARAAPTATAAPAPPPAPALPPPAPAPPPPAPGGD